ncbi:hypothetical protein NIES4072_25920 [Nostoc commune NIES-4072]|uniref:Uncharacterized protein n=1 Tax=Nostoc commune NIES-4072 TaxID=2005467 RepID=A0A2R5FJJ7_NOSCO|nr:hypothetical protein [Nostoc commune]BBD63752.1 hypothetical protein NIES4070_00940 [Nostoc commune HK-02]GBG18927.1 hypothetical protein NIES4072_25920 [Nostoc commune NIES-4072]
MQKAQKSLLSATLVLFTIQFNLVPFALEPLWIEVAIAPKSSSANWATSAGLCWYRSLHWLSSFFDVAIAWLSAQTRVIILPRG